MFHEPATGFAREIAHCRPGGGGRAQFRYNFYLIIIIRSKNEKNLPKTKFVNLWFDGIWMELAMLQWGVITSRGWQMLEINNLNMRNVINTLVRTLVMPVVSVVALHNNPQFCCWNVWPHIFLNFNIPGFAVCNPISCPRCMNERKIRAVDIFLEMNCDRYPEKLRTLNFYFYSYHNFITVYVLCAL